MTLICVCVCVVQSKQPSSCPSTLTPEKELFSDALLCANVYNSFTNIDKCLYSVTSDDMLEVTCATVINDIALL